MCGGYKKGANPSSFGYRVSAYRLVNTIARRSAGAGDFWRKVKKMSNREIIEWLKKKAEAVPMPGARKMYEAAAKALEAAQPELGTNLAEVGTDCISREQAIDALEKWLHGLFGITEADGTATIFKTIRQLPPIQPKRGEWIKTARWGRVYYCNQCRNYLDFDGVNAGRGSTNYCPNCGCRMDGGE